MSAQRSPDWIPHSKPTLRDADASAVAAAVSSGYVGSGSRVELFEGQVAARLNRKHARATTTGSAALHLALLASGVKPGDSVLLPAFVCRAVLNVVLACGGKPILVDIDPATFCITVETTRAAMTAGKVGAGTVLILVHSFGVAIDVSEFSELGLVIVEDAASSFGASSGGVPVGSSGFVSVLSFASTKMMTTGQGGMVLTSDDAAAKKIDQLMAYDSTDKTGASNGSAYNYGFTEMQAALGIAQLTELDGFIARRSAIASTYSKALSGTREVTLPFASAGMSWYRYILQTESAKKVVERLRASDIDARASVSHFLYDYTGSLRLRNAEKIRESIVSLPIYPSLTDDQVENICAATRAALEQTS